MSKAIKAFSEEVIDGVGRFEGHRAVIEIYGQRVWISGKTWPHAETARMIAEEHLALTLGRLLTDERNRHFQDQP